MWNKEANMRLTPIRYQIIFARLLNFIETDSGLIKTETLMRNLFSIIFFSKFCHLNSTEQTMWKALIIFFL